MAGAGHILCVYNTATVFNVAPICAARSNIDIQTSQRWQLGTTSKRAHLGERRASRVQLCPKLCGLPRVGTATCCIALQDHHWCLAKPAHLQNRLRISSIARVWRRNQALLPRTRQGHAATSWSPDDTLARLLPCPLAQPPLQIGAKTRPPNASTTMVRIHHVYTSALWVVGRAQVDL